MNEDMSKTIKQLISEVIEAGARFPNRWDLKTHYIDLVEEVGELGNAILVESGSKSKKRQRAELQDSFADVLFELILTADEAKVDLEKVLTHPLPQLICQNQMQTQQLEYRVRQTSQLICHIYRHRLENRFDNRQQPLQKLAQYNNLILAQE